MEINHWKVLYKLCVFYVDRNSKMTTTAGHSFYIGPIGSFYNQVNDTGSWELLIMKWWLYLIYIRPLFDQHTIVYRPIWLKYQSAGRHVTPFAKLYPNWEPNSLSSYYINVIKHTLWINWIYPDRGLTNWKNLLIEH